MRFRKTPVVIDAWQWSPGKDGWPHWLVKAIDSRDVIMAGDDQLVILTLEGDMKVSDGDWVIRGVAGELYPCKPDIFAVTYEPAE